MEKIYCCPAEQRHLCSWEGSSNDILEHFLEEHEDLLYSENPIKIDLHILPENNLLFFDGEIYLIQALIEGESKNEVEIRMRYLGPDYLARKISYGIELHPKSARSNGGKDVLLKQMDHGWKICFKIDQEFIYCNILIKKYFDDSLDVESPLDDIDLKTDLEKREYINVEDNQSNEIQCLNDSDIDRYLELPDEDTNGSSTTEVAAANTSTEESLNLNDYCDSSSVLSTPTTTLERNFRRNDPKRLSKISKGSRSSLVQLLPPNMFEEYDEKSLTCASCSCNMLPPIYKCTNNHNICIECKSQKCTYCFQEVTDNRNHELEEISRKSLHPCKYKSDGCSDLFSYDNLLNHQIRCRYFKYKCFIENCNAKAKFSDFISHCKMLHSSIAVTSLPKNPFPRGSEFFVANENIGIFYCQSVQDSEFVEWTAIFLGAKERRFHLSITFKGGKVKEPLFLKRQNDKYFLRKSLDELKKLKVKMKNAELEIISLE